MWSFRLEKEEAELFVGKNTVLFGFAVYVRFFGTKRASIREKQHRAQIK